MVYFIIHRRWNQYLSSSLQKKKKKKKNQTKTIKLMFTDFYTAMNICEAVRCLTFAVMIYELCKQEQSQKLDILRERESKRLGRNLFKISEMLIIIKILLIQALSIKQVHHCLTSWLYYKSSFTKLSLEVWSTQWVSNSQMIVCWLSSVTIRSTPESEIMFS